MYGMFEEKSKKRKRNEWNVEHTDPIKNQINDTNTNLKNLNCSVVEPCLRIIFVYISVFV